METEFQIAPSDTIEASLTIELPDFVLGKMPEFLKEMLKLSKVYLVGFEVGIVLDDLQSLVF